MPSYEVLNRKHKGYDSEMFSELCDLYTGGYQILKHARKYLPKYVGEHPARYKERLEQASYIPYFGQIIDYFVSNLFNQDLTVTPPSDSEDPETPGTLPDEAYYSQFNRNADRTGTPFADMVKLVFRDSIIYKKGILCVDFPSKENDAATRLEEDALGLADAYVYTHDSEDLIDWKKDDYGNFEWCKLAYSEDVDGDPLAPKKLRRDVFKVWEINKDGFASWEEYSIEYEECNPPNQKAEVPLTDNGVTKFKIIPVMVLDIPEGLWVGNKIGPLAKEHFRRRSALQSAESKSLMCIPVAGLASEVGAFQGALPSEAQQNPHRGDDPVGTFKEQGYLVVGAQDNLYYLEPTGNSYQIIDKELAELRDEMFRVVHQMSQGVTTSHGGALRRSGLSKIKDAEATVIILGEYGRLVRRFAERVYKSISDARREDVTWVSRGLDTFEVDARQELLDEATKVDLINIPSQTFKTEYKTQIALQLMGNQHSSVQQAVRTEIREGVGKETDILESLMKEGMLPQMTGMMPRAPSSSGGSSGAGEKAENISKGMVGLGKKVPKQMKPNHAQGQSRDFSGRFGPKI